MFYGEDDGSNTNSKYAFNLEFFQKFHFNSVKVARGYLLDWEVSLFKCRF